MKFLGSGIVFFLSFLLCVLNGYFFQIFEKGGRNKFLQLCSMNARTRQASFVIHLIEFEVGDKVDYTDFRVPLQCHYAPELAIPGQ